MAVAPVEGAATTNHMPMEKFTHDPLEDPSQQIRLLRILPADYREHITVTIEMFQRQYAPPYAASSYTWGDITLLKRIAANGKFLDITRERWYALGQLRLFGISEYYRIDAICINQQDDLEKSAQVNLMGATYRNATCTVVSLGRQTKEIALFVQQATKIEIECKNAEICSNTEIPGWLQALDETELERLSASPTAFGRLPYWDRLWTAQEFALSPSLLIACGTRCLEWSACDALNAMMCKIIDINKDWHAGKVALHTSSFSVMQLPMNRTGTLRSIVQNSPHGVAAFTEVVLRLGTRKCHDPRDRIFGLLSLIRWPDHGLGLKADYSIPASKVAEIALEYVGVTNRIAIADQLCDLLEISHTDPQMLLSAQRRPMDMEISNLQQAGIGPLPFWKPVGHIRDYHVINGFEKMEKVSRSWKRLRWIAIDVLIPISAEKGDVVGLCSFGNSRPGLERAALLLRKYANKTYEIKGHVVLSPEVRRGLWQFPFSERESFVILATDADLLFWTWQLRHGIGDCKIAGTTFERNPQWLETAFCTSPLLSYAKRIESTKASSSSLLPSSMKS